jgi:STE24 endopeptidase
MAPQTLFYIIIAIIVANFLIEKILGALNASRFYDPIPPEVANVYDEDTYRKSQRYKKERYGFGVFTSSVTLLATLLLFFLDGFAYVDALARGLVDGALAVALVFFGIILLAGDLLMLPFSYYSTFVIEERYGFNKTTYRTFFLDKLKGWGLTIIVGGLLLGVVIWLYQTAGTNFWWYAWLVVAIFTVATNLFYARLIVPIFNKQTPLRQGSLRGKIEKYAIKVGFTIDKIFVIDGSKRSTKANAYFSGFGKEKRITLYDTLIDDLEEDEIVAVLAHEVGHYKKNHIFVNLSVSLLTTALALWLLSLFVGSSLLSQALGVEQPSFHIGLIAFGILYTPISEVTGVFVNYLSRKFEYQADGYASTTYRAEPLITALKKLSKNSLSNLTPHPAYVVANYSHPTLVQRIENLKKLR